MEAVEAATKKKFDDGMVLEREIFTNLMFTPESRSLRHIFIADRAASKIADVPSDTPQRNIQSVAVIGAGTMGGGIAMNFVNVGIPVVLIETAQEALDRGLAVVRRNYENTVKRGRLSNDAMEKRLAMLTGSLDMQRLADCDLIIEAVFEDMTVKKAIFSQLDAIAKPGAILATNTSALDVNEIASAVSRIGNGHGHR